MRQAASFGGRGGGWVVAQFALMGLAVVAALVTPGWPQALRTPLLVAGLALAQAGLVVAVWSARVLGRALTPFPRPASGGALVVRGPYAVVRHPIYAGGILFFGGLALANGPVTAAVVCGLGVLWAFKLRVEERHLLSCYPGYAAYCARVRRRLVPGLY